MLISEDFRVRFYAPFSFFVIPHFIPTFAVMKKNIEIHLVDLSTSLPLPYDDEGIRAGFPSPAQDYMEQAIDLNKELIKHPSSTFYGRVVGDSMKGEGIEDGDILVIDKSLELIKEYPALQRTLLLANKSALHAASVR